MKDWLAKLAEQTKSEDEVLQEQIRNLSPEVLQELANEFDPPSQMDAMAEKIAQAEMMGRELAHERGGELIKEARIFGSQEPNTINHAAIPYEERKQHFTEHLQDKAKEEPTGYPMGMLGGTAVGGGLGALMGGLAGGRQGAMLGGGLGGLGGAGVGALLAKSDKDNIATAKSVLKSGKIDRHLSQSIADNADMDGINEELKHQQLLHELRSMRKEAGILQMGLGALKGFATGGAGGALMGAAKEGVKDAVSSGVKSTVARGVSNAVRGPTSAPGASSGFSYGKFAGMNLAGLGQRAAGFIHRNPGAAVTLAGAAGGALLAPRDPQTGQKQYLRGALMGGGVAAGANALSDGRLGAKAMKMVTRQNNPVFGQGARRYMIESAAKTRPGAASAAMAPKGDAIGGAAAMAQAPRAYSPEWAAAHQGAREMQEMGQITKHAPMPAPTPAAQRVGNFSFKNGPYDPQNPWGNVKVASPAGLILRAAIMSKVAGLGGAGAMFSTKLSPAKASGAVMGGGMKGLQAASKAVTPPPRPMARPAQGTGTFAAPAGPSPFAAPPRQAPARPAPAAGGLAGVQSQLNSARSIAGGGPIGGGGATIRAMPGSGW